MKLLTKELLREFGFEPKETKTAGIIEIMSRDGFDIVIKDGGQFFYSNVGIDYPLKELATLRKVFREVKKEDL